MKRMLALCLLLALFPLGLVRGEEAAAIREGYLAKSRQVRETEHTVIFPDGQTGEMREISKRPQRVTILFPSLVTLWYEAGGRAASVIGGPSATALYALRMGRDVTQDEGVTVAALSPAASQWSVEGILAGQPDLIVCSRAMAGFDTLRGPAAQAGIPLIPVEYEDFSDYLKWFRVFCLLNDREDLWTSVALPALEQAAQAVSQLPKGRSSRVLALFSGSSRSTTGLTEHSALGRMLGELGAENVLAGRGGERIPLSLEGIYAAQPDIILVQCHGSREEDQAALRRLYGDHPVWQALEAVKAGRVYYLEPALFHFKPNRDYAQAYALLTHLLYDP